MLSEKKMANAMGGKTARACDGCLRKRARWFCAADDAFLCQACDASVHSANQLASRHERVRLETVSSAKLNATGGGRDSSPPAWHQGFTRKARTPRHNKSVPGQQKGQEKLLNPVDPLVPEIGSEEGSGDENEELMLCRVPVFDPFAAELCDMVTSEENEAAGFPNEDGNMIVDDYGHEGTRELDGFLPSDVDLAEFAADVESLLGGGLDEDTCETKGVEILLNCKEEADTNVGYEHKIVKVKDEGAEAVAACCFDPDFDAARETLIWDFDYESPTLMVKEEEEKVEPTTKTTTMIGGDETKDDEMKRNIFLRLNYEEVISAWASQGSPWTTGIRPDFNPDDCWPDCKGMYSTDGQRLISGGMEGMFGGRESCDGEREARVSRYREKRRTRLFSKKIRYEVRKLNAEKRPRMKGRFVKRTSFMGTAFPYINQ